MRHAAIRGFWPAAVSALLLATQPGLAKSGDSSSITLPSQMLAKSLTVVGDSYRVTIIAPGALTRGRLAPAVSGDLTAMQAVSQLLAGSGLQARRSSSGVIIIEENVTEAVAAVEGQDTRTELAAADAEPAPPTFEEIVVRGEKIERPIFETTSSVAVMTGETIDNLSMTDLTDIYRLTPNVNVDDSGEGTFSIRGIGWGGVGFAGRANTASLYVNGVFQSDLGIEAGPLSSFDVSSVEIFRGPQSTLQGRNALAGAIMVHTRDPSYEWDARARVEVADYNTRRFAIAGGGPIVDDTLAFRVAIDYRETDGFIENPTLKRDDVDSDESINVRAKLLWEPGDRFRALFTYIYSEGIAGTAFGTGAVEGPDFAAREVNYNNVTRLDIDTNNFAASFNYELTDALNVELVTTYTDAGEVSGPRFPFDPETTNILDVGWDDEEVTTADLRLRYESERLRMVGGLYYFDADRQRFRDLQALLTAGPLSTTVSILENSGSETGNRAAYLDGEFALSDSIALLFGARYDREDVDVDAQGSTIFDPEIPPIAVSSVGNVLVADTTFDAFLPKLGLRWTFADNQNLGFVVQRGYRPGGAANNQAGEQYEYGPEYLWNYELSYRSVWLANRLLFSANLYYMDWEEQQAFIQGDGLSSITTNAGESRLYGLEADLRWVVSDTWSFFAAAGFNDTEFTDFSAVDPLLTGNEFPNSPRYQVSTGTIASFDSGFFLSADVSYTDGSFSDTANSPSAALPDVDNRNDAYTVVNTKIGYQADWWTANLFARNLFDEDYTLRMNRADIRSLGEGFATLGDPRVVGVEFFVDF